MNGSLRALALACACLLCGGCVHRCVVAHRAATALDLACAAAGVDPSDPVLLLECASATHRVKTQLEHGACKVHLDE